MGNAPSPRPRAGIVEYWLVGAGAQAPQRRLGAALDLRARLPGRGWRLVWGTAAIPTGVALRMPEDVIVRVTGRSGNFIRGIVVHDGLIETEFNGQEIRALIYCPWPRIIRHGDRIAQMWALPADREGLVFLAEAPAGVEAQKAGFGSTGR